MSEIDDRIRGALDADDREFLAALEDRRGMFRQIGDSLNGTMGGWAKVVFGMTFACGVLLLVSAWQMIEADDTRETILWAAATVSLVMTTGFLKDWMFSRMNMLSILREVKRLELQVALLAERQEPKV